MRIKRGGGTYLNAPNKFLKGCKNKQNCYNGDMSYHINKIKKGWFDSILKNLRMTKNAFTLAEDAAHVVLLENCRKAAFTLAEVLITLGIIGVVAAMTMPNLFSEYKKQETITRIKKTYSMLSQAVTLSVKDNGEVENWDFDLGVQEFMDKYLSGYFKNIVRIKDPSIVRYSKSYFLADGTMFQGWMYKNTRPEAYNVTTFFKIYVDINGDKKPNQFGRDKFIFYIFPKAQNGYNTGLGDCATMVPAGGLYPDGFGYDRERLTNDTWRGCDMRYNDEALGKGTDVGAFCTALIMMDGWNINYKW